MTKKSILLPLCAIFALASLHAESSGSLDPYALSLLKRMSDTLAKTKAFTFRTQSILEVPCATGQFITVTSAGKVDVLRPNKIRASYQGDAHSFEFFYDGDSVTAVAPLAGVFSSTKAPNNIDDMLAGIREQTGIHFHSAPLLLSDPYTHLTRNLLSAVIIGPASVDGVRCDHLAFRSTGVNWELWISSGKVALPYRLAATFTDRPNFPRKFINFSSWKLHPYLRSSLFVFSKPKDFKETPFKTMLSDARREATQPANR